MSWTLAGVAGETLATLAVALVASVLLLYFLRLRRRRIAVPFHPLWQRVLDSRRATHLWERLKWVASLLLHLLILGLLILALGDPRPVGSQQEGRSVVLMVDASASMSAWDEEGDRSRMERARELAGTVLDALGPRDEVMLVRFDGQLRPLTPFTRDTAMVEEGIARLEPSATAGDLGSAMQLAVDSLAGRTGGQIVLVSDGAISRSQLDTFDVALPQGVSFAHLGVGRQSGNVGITAFNVRRYPSNRTNYEFYAEVRNYTAVPITAELSIFGEGSLVHSEEIAIAADGRELRILPDLPAAGERLEARVRIVAGDAVDVMPLDDTAWALMPPRRPMRVQLVTMGNLYLEGPLLLNESILTSIVTPEQYLAKRDVPGEEPYDVVIFDGVTPPFADRGNFLFLNPAGPESPWRSESTVVDPIIHSTRSGDPILRWVSALREVHIARAQVLELERTDRAVATAIGGAPMIVSRDEGARRLIAFAFDPVESDLPLRVAFPVLLLNALDWFSGDSSRLIESYRTGRTWFIPLTDRSLDHVDVVAPDGNRFVAPANDGVAVFYGGQAGYHTVEAGSERIVIAGNLADSDESRIAPNRPLALPGITVETEFAAPGEVLDFDPWVLLLLVALLLIAVEWVTWNRRLTI